jgi:hypothetical protein
MTKGLNNDFGSMTLFGVTAQAPENVVETVQSSLGVVPEVFDWGTAGRYFFILTKATWSRTRK